MSTPSASDLATQLADLIYEKDELSHIELLANNVELPSIITYQEGVIGLYNKTILKIYGGLREELSRLFEESASDNWTMESRKRVWKLTLISILATTENLRAINIRKRLIKENPDIFRPIEELRILSVIFGSPLQKQTKSPMLWQHRRWVIETILASASESTNTNHERTYKRVYKKETVLSPLELEFEVVFLAGELHPRNYYAWAYARWLLDNHDQHSAHEWLIERVYEVCKTHVSDISAWAFLQRLLENNDEGRRKYRTKCHELTRTCQQHESMWTFLRWGYGLDGDDVPDGDWDETYRASAREWWAHSTRN